MQPDRDAKARDKIVFYLKTGGPLTAGELAQKLRITAIAVRQHLQSLESEGLVSHTRKKGRVGRPAHVWCLTDAAQAQFPDRHADFSLGLLASVRRLYGDAGVRSVVDEWVRVETDRCQDAMKGCGDTAADRVKALVSLRRRQGYMAELTEGENGNLHLVENHCPINSAACVCEEICDAELELFRDLLGRDVPIQRDEHIASGDRRCVYRIDTSPRE